MTHYHEITRTKTFHRRNSTQRPSPLTKRSLSSSLPPSSFFVHRPSIHGHRSSSVDPSLPIVPCSLVLQSTKPKRRIEHTCRLVGSGFKLLTLAAAPVGAIVTFPVGATVAATHYTSYIISLNGLKEVNVSFRWMTIDGGIPMVT